MKLFLIVCIVFCSLLACGSKNKYKESKQYFPVMDSLPKNADKLYFPLDSLFFTSNITNRFGDSSIKSICSKILFSINEPIIYNRIGEQYIMRLLWLRPFDEPVMIRLNKLGEKIYANIKEAKKEYSDEENFKYKIGLDTTITLEFFEWNKIVSFLDHDKFWSANSSDTLNAYEDETRWVFESRFRNKYRCITRVYSDSLSLREFNFIKEMYNIGGKVTQMENSRTHPGSP